MRDINTERPIKNPSGIPTAAAKVKPSATRLSEAIMFQPTPKSLGPLR